MKILTFVGFLILSLTFVMPTQVESQPIGDEEFAPLGAKWWYRTYASNCNNNNYFTIESKRDTLIDDRLLRILEIDWNDRPDKFSTIVIHSHEEKVYFYEDEEFKLLYDFSLLPGDTLWHHIPKNRRSLDVGHTNEEDIPFLLEESPFPFVLTAIDTVELNGYETRQFHFLPAGFFDLWMPTIVEPVGNLEALIAMVDIRPTTSSCFGYLRCYSDHRFSHQFSTEGCTISNLKEISKEEFNLFPNPTKTHLNVSGLEGYKMENYRIYDISGKLVKSGAFGKALDLKGIPAGTYLIHFTSSLFEASGQFVKID